MVTDARIAKLNADRRMALIAEPGPRSRSAGTGPCRAERPLPGHCRPLSGLAPVTASGEPLLANQGQ
eukprot:85008-Hanusia_phi.AAC.1